jgi:hypothetical protein
MEKLLLDFLKKEFSFKWKEELNIGHLRLEKKKLSSTPILEFFDFTKMFKVHTKASDFDIERVLMQELHLFFF